MLSDVWTRTAAKPTSESRSDSVVRSFHGRLPGYQATRLVALPSIAERLGVAAVNVKFEESRFGLPSFKILGASWAVYQTVAQQLGITVDRLDSQWDDLDGLRLIVAPLRPLTLVTATDGNHGRAVARMASLLGFSAHVFVPDDMAPARIAALSAEGARVDVVRGDYDESVRRAAESATPTRLVISDTSWDGYTDVPTWISEGYRTIFEEVDETLAETAQGQPTAVLVPVGVGALASATLNYYANTTTSIIAVEPHGADCVTQSLRRGRPVAVPGPYTSIMAGLNCGTPSDIAWPLMRDRLDASVVITNAAAEEATRELAKSGLAVGETGAASTGAVLALATESDARERLRLGADSRVLLLATESVTDPVRYADILRGRTTQAR